MVPVRFAEAPSATELLYVCAPVVFTAAALIFVVPVATAVEPPEVRLESAVVAPTLPAKVVEVSAIVCSDCPPAEAPSTVPRAMVLVPALRMVSELSVVSVVPKLIGVFVVAIVPPRLFAPRTACTPPVKFVVSPEVSPICVVPVLLNTVAPPIVPPPRILTP